MEADDALGAADAAEGGGLENEPHGAVSIVGGGNDAGLGGDAPQFLGKLRLTEDQAVHIHFQSPADQLGLITAEHHGFCGVEQQIFPVLGQGDGHIAGNGINALAGLVEDLALQHIQKVKQRHLLQPARVYKAHVVICHILPAQHTEEGAVIIGHGDGGRGFPQHLPCPVHGNGGRKDGRLIKIQVTDLGVHTVDPGGGGEAEPVQYDLSLVGNMTQAGGLVFPVAQCVSQGGIGHGGHDGVGVRIAMTGNIDLIHMSTS